MEAIFREIKERYAKADDNDKREIQGYIRELQVDFYTDWDVIMRLTSGVSSHVPTSFRLLSAKGQRLTMC